MKLNVFFDGASRGNPGPAGAGFLIQDEKGSVIKEGYKYLGECTNNSAEYKALILSIESILELRENLPLIKTADIAIYSDSELVIKQMKGQYRVKNKGLAPLWQKANELLSLIGKVSFYNIPREENKKADKLANLAIDRVKNSS